MSEPKLLIYEDQTSLSSALGEFVAKLSAEAISKHNKFTIALSGGSLPGLLSPFLVKEPLKSSIQWEKWHIFFSDERFVPLTDTDSNFLACNKELFSKVPILKENIYFVKTTNITLNDSAVDYQNTVSTIVGNVPKFDLILLGMGPDGHTASLFPDHPLLKEKDKWISFVEDSPKPPPKRVTFTLPLINHAKHVAFVAAGEGKKETLRDVFKKHSQLPSSLVRPVDGELLWFVDRGAATYLHSNQ